MGTIASLNVAASVDPTGIREGLEEGLRAVERFQRELEIMPGDNVLVAEGQGAGAKIVYSLMQELNAGFDRNKDKIKEGLFRGLVSRQDAQAAGALNAAEFNAGIIRGINQLAASGQLSAKLRTALVAELRTAGLQAGDALRGAIATRLVETQGILTRTGDVAHTALGQRGVRAAQAFAYGLERVAIGGAGAEGGVRRALGAVSQFAGFFGVGGLVVAGFAAAGLAITNYFSHAREEIRKTRETFLEEVNRMVNAGDQLGLTRALQTLEQGPLSDPAAGLNAMKSRAAALRAVLAAQPDLVASSFAAAKVGGGGVLRDSPLGRMIIQQGQELRDLEPKVLELEAQRKILEGRIRNPPPARRPITGLESEIRADSPARAAKEETQLVKQAAAEFLRDMNALVSASQLGLTGEEAVEGLSERLIRAYDKVGAALERQKDKIAPYALELRKLRTELEQTPIIQLIRGTLPLPSGAVLTPGAGGGMPGDIHDMQRPHPRATGVTPALPTVEFSRTEFVLASFRNSISDTADELKVRLKEMGADFTLTGLALSSFGGFLEVVNPVLEALREPIRIVGEILGRALAPILRATFPIFKGLAIAATYVGEVLFKVAGAILYGVGSLVKGIGRLVNILPGSPGNPLVRAGQAMLDLANSFREGARELAAGRDELRNLDFDKALDNVTSAANAAAEALENVPAGWNAALAALEAGRATVPFSAPPPSALGGGGGSSSGFPVGYVPPTGGFGPGPITLPFSPTLNVPVGGIQVNGNRSGREMARELLDALMQLSLEQFGTTARWPEVVPG